MSSRVFDEEILYLVKHYSKKKKGVNPKKNKNIATRL